MKRAVITGATGAIGIAIIKELVKRGTEVLVLCREGSSRNGNIPADPLISRKYCSLQQLSSVENDTGKNYDVFYHLAWEGTAGTARNDMYLQNKNVQYALDAVKAAKIFGCYTFIGAGSQAEYGRSDKPLTADTPAFPENGYGIAKLCAGQMTREYARSIGLKHIWVRILSVYGPNDGKNSMVSLAIDKLQRGEVPQFTKGEQIWDYLYSGDAAKAFALLGDKGTDGKTYVLGSGEKRPLAEYIKDIRDVVAPHMQLALGAVPYGERQVMYLTADISEIFSDTGWKPETPFRQGIKNILKAQEV